MDVLNLSVSKAAKKIHVLREILGLIKYEQQQNSRSICSFAQGGREGRLPEPYRRISHSRACVHMSERHHDGSRIGSLALLSSQMRAGSHSAHVTDVEEPGGEEPSAVCNVLQHERDIRLEWELLTHNVSLLQSGQEVQCGAGLIATAFALERCVRGFSTQCCSFPPVVWKTEAGTTNGELDTVNMCRHVTKLVAFCLRWIISRVLVCSLICVRVLCMWSCCLSWWWLLWH